MVSRWTDCLGFPSPTLLARRELGDFCQYFGEARDHDPGEVFAAVAQFTRGFRSTFAAWQERDARGPMGGPRGGGGGPDGRRAIPRIPQLRRGDGVMGPRRRAAEAPEGGFGAAAGGTGPAAPRGPSGGPRRRERGGSVLV